MQSRTAGGSNCSTGYIKSCLNADSKHHPAVITTVKKECYLGMFDSDFFIAHVLNAVWMQYLLRDVMK
jgi:hypothetical protein